MTFADSSVAAPGALTSRRPLVAPTGRVFLSAQWRALAMLNYEVPPELVAPYVPAGTAIDFHAGKTYASLVGFLFRETRVLGLSIPWHIRFEEVNLRLYVRRELPGEIRHGVVFVRELVPRTAIATVARWAYNEPYLAVPMEHRIQNYELSQSPCGSEAPHVSYSWGRGATRCEMRLEAQGRALHLQPGSHEEFIAEHYWGYCRQRDGGTVEYRVEHPSWNAWRAAEASVCGDLAHYYGRDFAELLARPPTSALLADGSPVQVYRPTRLG